MLLARPEQNAAKHSCDQNSSSKIEYAVLGYFSEHGRPQLKKKRFLSGIARIRGGLGVQRPKNLGGRVAFGYFPDDPESF